MTYAQSINQLTQKYIVYQGKKYLSCTYCKHLKTGSRCALYGCWCGSHDGCTEESILKAEKELEDAQ